MLQALETGVGPEQQAAPQDKIALPDGARAQGAVALDLDDPQRQPPASEPRRVEGRRSPGLERLGRDPDDGALFRRAAPAGPGCGKASCLPGLPRDPVPARPSEPAKLERFRAFGGAQSYPSRTKDGETVDFSTGSVGLGVGITLFASIAQDYLRLKELVPTDGPPGRMVALAGDAELDEGNIFEALLEGWKHDVRNLWWVIDYNRQSLDAVVSDRLFGRIDALFEMMGWRVLTLKYGRLLEAAFARADGHHLREWIDACPNSLYSALVYKGGEGWREHLHRDLNRYPGIRAILDDA